MEPVPKIGDKHHFFDDGKIRESRHFIAEVLSVITPEEAKQIKLARTEYYKDEPYTFTQSLYERWVEEVNDHRQGEHPWVLVYSNKYKPYLLPLESLTEEQRDFLHKNPYGIYIQLFDNTLISASTEGFNWLNTHHFDYRGLIPKGLAIDATNLNIY